MNSTCFTLATLVGTPLTAFVKLGLSTDEPGPKEFNFGWLHGYGTMGPMEGVMFLAGLMLGNAAKLTCNADRIHQFMRMAMEKAGLTVNNIIPITEHQETYLRSLQNDDAMKWVMKKSNELTRKSLREMMQQTASAVGPYQRSL